MLCLHVGQERDLRTEEAPVTECVVGARGEDALIGHHRAGMDVDADEARADIMIRLVGDSSETKAALARAVEGRAELREVIEIPALRLNGLDGIETTVVAYTTDIPAFGGQWGEPFLIGPGSIHVAHTLEERIPKAQLTEAVGIYQRMVKQLCKRESK